MYYDENALKLNNYSLYFKPYSLWKKSCQYEYSTYDMAAQGENIGKMSKLYTGLITMSIIQYGIISFELIFFLSFLKCHQMTTLKVSIILLSFIEFAGFIALIVI